MATSLTAIGVQFPDNSVQTAPALTGFRNRIINGNMSIDQRKSGASTSYGSGTTAGNYFSYNIDRWWAQALSTVTGNAAAFTVQQNAGNVTPPHGYSTYLGVTVTSAQSTLQGYSLYRIQQPIEGVNFVDLAWGTINAKSATLSFWARSSITGVFSGHVSNAGNGGVIHRYIFAYSIYSVNNWEYKTVTIPGATTGAWSTSSSIGILIMWALGASNLYLGTANIWDIGEQYSVSGAINLMTTVGATSAITGVQLEKGSSATEFEFRPYPVELAMCQRYYERRTVGSQNNERLTTTGFATSSSGAQFPIQHLVQKRSIPTIVVANVGSTHVYDGGGVSIPTAWSLDNTGIYITNIYLSGITSALGRGAHWGWNNVNPLPYVEIISEL